MKKLTIFLILVFLILMCYVPSNIFPQMRLKDKYYIGAWGGGIYNENNPPPGIIYFHDVNSNHWGNYQALKFNIRQQYIPAGFPWFNENNNTFQYIGSFYDNINYYIQNLQNVFTFSNNNNIELVLERYKSEYPAYGQSSIYQAEKFYEGTTTECYMMRPGYGYKSHPIGEDYFDPTASVNGKWVRKCIIGTDAPAQYIVCALHENCEQVNDISDDLRFSDKKFPALTDYRWYIKPKMRIEGWENLDPETPVVRIDIIRFDGTLVKSVPMTIEDFYDNPGEYKEYFNFHGQPTDYPLSVTGIDLNTGNDGNIPGSQVDYRITWYGNVDVYLDYVKVEDEFAHFLFNPSSDPYIDRWQFFPKITGSNGEATIFKNSNAFGQFYVDEFQYNNIPCIIKTKEIIEAASDYKLTIEPSFNLNSLHGRNFTLRNCLKFDDACFDDFINQGLIKDFIRTGMLPFLSNGGLTLCPSNLDYDDQSSNLDPQIQIFYNNNKASNKELYNEAIERELEYFSDLGNNNYYISNLYGIRNAAKAIIRARNQGKTINMVFQDQVGTDEVNIVNYGNNNLNACIWREPTNEEIWYQAFLGLAYGAKQTWHYDYISNQWDYNGYTYHTYGLADGDENASKRYYNVFKYSNGQHQNKWESMCTLDTKLNAIGDYLYPPGYTNRHKYYEGTITVNTLPSIENKPDYFYEPRGFNNPHNPFVNTLPTYISDIQSIYRNSNTPHNYDQNDEDAKRYWELGFFENNPNYDDLSEKYSHYFIALNKRCTPESPNSYDGDLRKLTIKFKSNASELAGFTNWKLLDPISGNTLATINKNSSDYYDAGIFQPGEGKLFKLAPVVQEGGSFITDELQELDGIRVNCKGTVYTNGKYFNMYNETIEFNEYCGIVVNGGGIDWEGNPNQLNNLKGKNGAKWSGISITNTNNTYIGYTYFEDVINGGWALSVSNCSDIFIKNNNFMFNNDDLAGVILINNIRNNNSINTYINANIINVRNVNSAVAIYNSGGSSGEVNFEYNCIYITNNGNGNSGCFMSNVYFSKFYHNTISGFDIGVNLMNCQPQFLGNTIASSKNGSIGINASANSNMIMTYINSYYSGGTNIISNFGTDCYNINLNTATFMMDEGRNSFMVIHNTNSKNIYGQGNFLTEEDRKIDATRNCFNGMNGNSICTIWNAIGPFTLNELPHDCSGITDAEVDFIIPLANNEKDTVYKKSVNNNQNYSTCLALYKGLYINNRKKEFDSAAIKCIDLLTNYTDSIFTPDVIAKLYLATVNIDSAGFGVQALKTFYEQLIINHSQDTTLIKSANYFVQKCKVYLKQYSSALIGFEDIINQNPYSYEGLLASWDYAATLLLIDTTQGAGGRNTKESLVEFFSSHNANEYLIDSLRLIKVMKYDNYDSKVFTNSNRLTLFKTTGNVFTGERNKQIERFKDIEKKSKNDNEKESLRAKREFADLKALNEAVKVKRPKNETEYIKILNDDIKNVFKNRNENIDTKAENIIPNKFELYQNYPNPFNPVTKISFDLPKDGKVKLIIYDILGREITRLLNSEFKQAGKYVVEFNSVNLNLASGVYFYRIEAGDFVNVKKMILIK